MGDPLLAIDLSREDATRSKYEQLRDHLISQMRSGRLVPGQMLPSEQSIVESLGVARTTVRQAMASLENEGLIRRVQGKGTFVDENVHRKLKHGNDIFALVVIETHTGFYPSLLRGFDAAADEVKHRTIVCGTDDNVERQGDIVLQLLDQKVGGVAINPTNHRPTPAYHIRQLQANSVPVVFLFRRVEGITAPVLAIPFAEVGGEPPRLSSSGGTSGPPVLRRGRRRRASCANTAFIRRFGPAVATPRFNGFTSKRERSARRKRRSRRRFRRCLPRRIRQRLFLPLSIRWRK